jgi:hypothetical protein
MGDFTVPEGHGYPLVLGIYIPVLSRFLILKGKRTIKGSFWNAEPDNTGINYMRNTGKNSQQQ